MNDSSPALETIDLGKHYRRGWALRDCSISLPTQKVVALVGPNGAGKSTLLALAAGILAPTTGSIKVLGEAAGHRGPHPKLAFLSQDKPLYRRFTVEEILRFGGAMNTEWDDHYARRLVKEGNIPLTARVGTLSGGERTRVALAVALGRRPAVLLLDEPLASLDPLARTEVMQTLMAEVVDTGITVVLSSHVIADIEDLCEQLLLLMNGRLQLSGAIEELLAEHSILTGPAGVGHPWLAAGGLLEIRETARQTTILGRGAGIAPPAGWTKDAPTLEELVLAYLRVKESSPPKEWESVA